MLKRGIVALFVFTFIEAPLWADTLTLRNNAEINGSVQYMNDAFTITARYTSGDQTITYDRREVRTLEINSRNFNSGEPPTNISMFGKRVPGTEDAGHTEPAANVPRKEKPPQKKGPGAANLSIFTTDNYDRMTMDVVLLKNKMRLVGRIASLQNGLLTIQGGNENEQISTQQVAKVLVAEQ